MLKEYMLNDHRDLLAYGGIVSELSPTSILDVGMFLKRVGAVSRSFRNFSIPGKTLLCGVDFFEDELAVYQRIYTKTVDMAGAEKLLSGEHFDLVVMLGIEGLIGEEDYKRLLELISEGGSFILTDEKYVVENLKQMTSSVFTIENKSYYIMH